MDMLIKIFFNLILFQIFTNFQIFSQNIHDDFRFVKIGIEQGLSQSTIYSILQDKRGYLWFGTANGLNRYDGYEFVVYTNNPDDSSSISDNEITSLYEDAEGYLWIGTAKGILNKFDPNTETFTHFDIANTSDWYLTEDEVFFNYPLTFTRNQNSSITTIAQDQNGYLWIGTWGKGLLKFNPETNQKKYFYYFQNKPNSLSSNKIVKICVDAQNNVWIGTFGGGLNRIDGSETTKATILSRNTSKKLFEKLGDRITSITTDQNGNLIIGDYGKGISIINASTKYLQPSKWQISKLNLNIQTKENFPNIMAVCKDKQNDLWIGTYGNGLIKYNRRKKTFQQFTNSDDPNSISENEIQSIYVDNSGIVWIGTQLGSGVNKLEPDKNKFKTFPVSSGDGKSLNDNIVWSIYEDNENSLWIGTYRGGLNKLDNKNGNFKYFKKDKIWDNHVRAITEDYNNNLWIGTFSNGVTFYDRRKDKFRNFRMGESSRDLKSNQIQSFLIENDSTLYIGTFGGGLSQLSLKEFYKTGVPKFRTYTHNPSDLFSISDDRVYCMMIDSKGNFWIGTDGSGLNLFNRDEKIFTSFNSGKNFKGNISDTRIMNIAEAKDGKLLIGTFGSGLDLFDPGTEMFTSINKMNGMNCSDVYCVFDDNFSGYWLSTNNGIYKLDYSLQSFVRYDLSDGLQSLEFNGGAYFKSDDGRIYFGGINGINFFNPKDINSDKFVAPVVITKIKLFDKEIKGEKKKLVFTREQNYFSFEFASLDFKNSGKNKYKYMLEGLDKTWSYTDAENRKVYYTNLNPGDYKFIVNGTNNDGIWSPKSASVNITILAPFWMQWWFISLLILLVGGLITFYINQRIRYLIAMDKLKTNLSADLHDNVGAGLTEISILSELAATEIPNTNASKNLAKISELSRQLVESMSDIVWVVNPNRASLYDLIVRLKDSYAELLGEMGINLHSSDLEKLTDIKLSMEIRQNLYLILKESINNSIKHSESKNINLTINENGKSMIIEVKDDGKGFDINNVNYGNGLINMRERAKKIGWEISILSQLEIGTKVIFKGKIK